MPLKSHQTTLLFATLGLAACVLSGAASAGSLQRDGDRYVAREDLGTFYDYILVRTDAGTRTPRSMDARAAAQVLADYDVVFIGEVHRHPGNHKAQMDLFFAIYDLYPGLTLSLEQFERDVQNVVDDYMAGKIGESTLRQRARAWDNYPGSYRPLVEFAKERGLPVVAAEVPTSVVRCVGQEGPEALDRLKGDKRQWAAAELHLDPGPYREKYMSFLGDSSTHGKDDGADATNDEGPSPAALRSFAAQVTRDDTMAESIFLHLQNNPSRKVVHLNGSFHSESFLGTAERLLLRKPDLKIAVVNPIEIEDPEKPSFTSDEAKSGTFVLLLKKTPEAYSSEAEAVEAIKAEMAQRRGDVCEF